MKVNDAFKTTCRIVLGREIGELEEYEEYFMEALIGRYVKSNFSGEKVFCTSGEYCSGARFFDYEAEREQVAKLMAKPLNINEIKDVDSLFRAVNERVVYSGNKVLGNSKCVEGSDNILDGMHILKSSVLENCAYTAYSYGSGRSKYMFAVTSSGESESIIRCFYNLKLKRSFECSYTNISSDCYFCYNLLNSQDCMFSFNLRSKRNVIGNIQLERTRYSGLKTKLLGEIVDELRKRKRLDFSIINIHKARRETDERG